MFLHRSPRNVWRHHQPLRPRANSLLASTLVLLDFSLVVRLQAATLPVPHAQKVQLALRHRRGLPKLKPASRKRREDPWPMHERVERKAPRRGRLAQPPAKASLHSQRRQRRLVSQPMLLTTPLLPLLPQLPTRLPPRRSSRNPRRRHSSPHALVARALPLALLLR